MLAVRRLPPIRWLPLALGLVMLPGSPVQADSLLDVYEQARERDPQFQQAIADRQAREEALPQARAALRPSVTISSAFSGIDTDSDFSEPPTGSEQYRQLSYGVELSQTLYRYSRARSVDQATVLVEQAQADFASAQQALILRVAERYFDVLDARKALDAAEANLDAIQRQLEQAERRFEVGVIDRTDVEEARAQADLGQAELLQAQDDLETERERLRELTGRASTTLLPVREGVELTRPSPREPEAWREQAEADNWQLVAAQLAAEAAMEGVEVERGERFPQVDLVAGYDRVNRYGFRGRDPSSDEFSARIQLSFPLYQGGGVSSRVREAQFRYTEARETLEEVRRTVGRDAADAYRGTLTALQRVQALDQARVSTQAALEATEAGFNVGSRTIVDVLNAQREVFNAERDYQQARHAFLLNTLRLQQAAGALDEDDLRAVNALLERG